MSKCVLVMGMPNRCTECRLASLVGREDVMCAIIDRMATRKYADACKDRPDWCPLKPMIEKKDRNKVVGDYLRGRCDGYNACIDELLKGEE